MTRTAHLESVVQTLGLSTASWADGKPENQDHIAPGGLGAYVLSRAAMHTAS